MENNVKTDWVQWGEWFDIYWFHGCYLPGVIFGILERLGYGLDHVVGEIDGDVNRIYMSESEWKEMGKKFMNEVVDNPEKLRTVLKDIRVSAAALFAFSRKIETINVSVITKEQYVPLLREYHDLHHRLWSLGMVPNVLDLENDVMRVYLKELLSEVGVASSDREQAFQALIVPTALSMAQEEERDMLRLALRLQSSDAIRKHWETYRSIQFGWTGPDLSMEYFNDAHERLLRGGTARAILEQVEKTHTEAVQEKEKWIQVLPADSRELFSLYEELLAMKTRRMDALFLSYSAIQPLLKKIARDYFLSLKQVYALYIPWLIVMIETNTVDGARINDIGRYSIQYLHDGVLHLLVGDEARVYMEPIKRTLPPPPLLSELSGECAFPGNVTGKVCIVNRASEMEKFETGDILVSNVTDPSLLPIMKKAAAFVTNMGGLTCHAAIVARELKTPCVVGTKIATRVFKDGDMVEVDAEKGTVKKLH